MLAVGLVLPVLRATEFFVLEQPNSPSPTASRLRLITKRTLIPRWGTPDVQPSATRGTAIPGAVPERGKPSTCWDDVVRLSPERAHPPIHPRCEPTLRHTHIPSKVASVKPKGAGVAVRINPETGSSPESIINAPIDRDSRACPGL